MKEVVELANQFVRDHEEELWKGLYVHKEEAQHRAESCGCPNCKKEAIGADEAFSEEAIRMFGQSEFDDPEAIPQRAKVYQHKEAHGD